MAIIFGLGLVFAHFARLARERRAREYAAMAKRHGFWMHTAEPPGCGTFGFGSLNVAGDPVGLLAYVQSFEPFDTGHDKLVQNFIWGSESGSNWFVFDYQYRSGSGDDETTYNFSVVVSELPVDLPPLLVRDQGFWDGVGGMVGIKDLQFESDEFNRRFWVGTSDNKRTYELLHPQMMEYLMKFSTIHFQMLGPWFVCRIKGEASVGQLERTMIDMQGFVERIPDFYKQDNKRRIGSWTTQP